MLQRRITVPALVLVALALSLLVHGSAYPFGKNKVNREQYRWHILKTIHFDIYYPGGMERLAVMTASLCEEGYVHIANSLRHELTDVIPVIVYPSHIAFQENNIIMEIIDEGVGGFTEGFKTRVVVPFTGSYGDFRHVLTHELVHAFQYNMLFNDETGQTGRFSTRGMPLWIMEGIAEYLSIGYDETADMVMRDILFNEHYASLMDLTDLHVRSGYLLYKEGQAFFYFFERQYGREKLGELFRDIRDLDSFDKAVEAATGKNLEKLNREWIRFFKKRYFPIIKGKKFDEEEGEQITFHQKTNSVFNMCPAISPDGKKIAYISNRDIYASITVVELAKKKKKGRVITTLLQGQTSARFEGMHLVGNNLSWSRDGSTIAFAAQSNGRDSVFLIDAATGAVREAVALPFRSVREPALSPDGSRIVFIGQTNDQADVYLYQRRARKLERITDDRFAKRSPRISSDNGFIVYSTNANPAGDFGRDDYNLMRYDCATRAVRALVVKPGNDLQADLSPDDSSILYISNRTGIYNLYRYSLATGADERITDVLCGLFTPRWFPDKNRIAFVAYQNLGYDIFVRDISKLAPVKSTERDTEQSLVAFPPSYFPLSDMRIEPYETRFSKDMVILAITATTGYGIAGIVQAGVSDYLGNHQLVFTSNYFRYRGEDMVNFDIAYYYLKRRWDFGVGVFRYENPFGVFTLNTINELIHNVHWDTISMKHYGVYGIAQYPFSKFSRFECKVTSSRYEIDYSSRSIRHDVFANLNQVSAGLSYDNAIWGYLGPLDGFRGKFEFQQAVDCTGHDYVYSNAGFDLRQYFLISKRHVFSLRESGGKVFGRDSDSFKYYLGGFTTLRGYDFLAFSGKNAVFAQAEYRVIFIEGIRFGWPIQGTTMPIGGVLFADCGSAWDNNYTFRNPKTKEFQDFKLDMGFGFRLTLWPIIFKLDYAWPYNYITFGEQRILFSIGLIYWD